jgi:ABC-type transport system involved in cytochrome c biogenesis permease subunit
MFSFAANAFVAAFWASVFWGTIWIVDRQKEKNTLRLALRGD